VTCKIRRRLTEEHPLRPARHSSSTDETAAFPVQRGLKQMVR